MARLAPELRCRDARQGTVVEARLVALGQGLAAELVLVRLVGLERLVLCYTPARAAVLLAGAGRAELGRKPGIEVLYPSSRKGSNWNRVHW